MCVCVCVDCSKSSKIIRWCSFILYQKNNSSGTSTSGKLAGTSMLNAKRTLLKKIKPLIHCSHPSWRIRLQSRYFLSTACHQRRYNMLTSVFH